MRVINKFMVPSYDDESRASLTILAIDDKNCIEELEDLYENNRIEFKNEILDFLGECEEYNVMPGDLYSRYDVFMLNGLVLIYCNTKYNI